MTYFNSRPFPRAAGKIKVGTGNYQPDATYAGIPNEGGYYIGRSGQRPGYFGYYNPAIAPSLSQPSDPKLLYYYSEGSDTDNVGTGPVAFYGGLQRFGAMFTNPDQYGASRQGTNGFTYGDGGIGGGGYSSYPSDLGDKAGYFGNQPTF